LITRVWTREEAFSGPNMNNAPDLTVELRDKGFISVRRTNSTHAKRAYMIGTHHPEGILIARGPGVRHQAQAEPVHLTDVAPTALYCMDLPIPTDLEGRVIEDLFTPEFLASRKPKRSVPVNQALDGASGEHANNGSSSRSIDGPEGASEEDRDILEKMKALGYLE